MSNTNKHRSNQVNSLSILYIQKELKIIKQCPRRSCTGTCSEVYTRYCDHGPINIEHECTSCGKVIKDPRFKKEREQRWRNRKKGRRNANNSRSS